MVEFRFIENEILISPYQNEGETVLYNEFSKFWSTYITYMNIEIIISNYVVV